MSSKKSKSKSTPKPPKSRPESTSALSQPSVAQSSTSVLSAFSSSGSLYALVSLSVDKHRLRVYDARAKTGRNVAEWTIQDGRVGVLEWARISVPATNTQDDEGPRKKRKKRKLDSDIPSQMKTQPQNTEEEVIILGLSTGSIQIFSPSQSKIIYELSHPSSTSPILAVSVASSSKGSSQTLQTLLWTSSKDCLRLWDLTTQTVLRTSKNEDRVGYTALAVLPPLSSASREGSAENEGNDDDDTRLLAAHHNIRLLSLSEADNSSEESSSFTGHASPIMHLRWVPTESFVSAAENDRFIYLWDASNSTSNQKPSASVSLDADVRKVVIYSSTSSDDSDASDSEDAEDDASKSKTSTTLIALSSTGALSFVPVPAQIPTENSKGGGIYTLLSKTSLSNAGIVDICSLNGENEGEVRVVRLVNGVKPIFDDVRFLNNSGTYIQNLKLDAIPSSLSASVAAEDDDAASPQTQTKRYKENPTLGVSSGIEPDFAEVDVGSKAQRDIEGDLADLDLAEDDDGAEMTLGERLAISGGNPDAGSSDDESSSADAPLQKSKSKSTSKSKTTSSQPVPASSLTRTLIQALHSSDSKLLEQCLAHSDTTLIQNTVRSLPPQLVMSLIQGCVERLGRGARMTSAIKGGGSGCSPQRGMTLVKWINSALTIHMAHLMTIPDVVARLAGLWGEMERRTRGYEGLVGLKGRLEVVVGGVEARGMAQPRMISGKGKGKGGKDAKQVEVKRYVEGRDDSSSSSDEEDAHMDVEVEVGGESDEEGSVEDVELGGDSDSESSASLSGDDDDDEGEDSEDGELNEFVDDEAEEDEYSEDEESD